MQVERQTIAVTTAADGSATVNSTNVTGRILGIRYVKPGSGGFDDGVGATITLEATGEAVLTTTNMNATATYYPRPGVNDAAGAAATLDGTRLSRDYVYAANDRLKIVIAAGGNAKVGSFWLIVG